MALMLVAHCEMQDHYRLVSRLPDQDTLPISKLAKTDPSGVISPLNLSYGYNPQTIPP
jgi:hypothetical protein